MIIKVEPKLKLKKFRIITLDTLNTRLAGIEVLENGAKYIYELDALEVTEIIE